MIGYIKYQLRSLRAEGKYRTFINLLIAGNYHYKSAKQRIGRNAADRVLMKQQFGNSPREWVNFIWGACNGFFRPIQDPDELLKLVEIIEKRKPSTVLEIGTANGGSLFLFCRAAASNAIVVSIDLPGGVNGGGFPSWKTDLYKRFAGKNQTLSLQRCDSHLESTKETVKNIVPDGEFDLVMIDADHSYGGVKHDFELYSSIVAEGGIIVLHDIIKNIYDPTIQVDRFWNELRRKYKTLEIISNKNLGNMGIGIVFL